MKIVTCEKTGADNITELQTDGCSLLKEEQSKKDLLKVFKELGYEIKI